MPHTGAQPIAIDLGNGERVSGLLRAPLNARACFVLAHGAGAGMTHPWLEAVAEGLAERGVATLRYQFVYMERDSKRTDPPAIAHAAVRAAVAKMSGLAPGLPLIAGGKSFGGRMTSQAQAASPLPGVRALAFLGFPLHPPGRPAEERGKHLVDVRIPMLFLQGSRDEFADLTLLRALVDRLGERAALRLFENADHSFHVPRRSGRTDAETRAAMLDAFVEWTTVVIGK